MADKSWKAFERRIAKRFGGKRRGADYGGFAGGTNDIICEGFSVECKLYKRPSYGMMVDACFQAEAAREKFTDAAVAVVKKKGARDNDALVIMRLEEFERNYLGG
jgi:hypothetical protein